MTLTRSSTTPSMSSRARTTVHKNNNWHQVHPLTVPYLSVVRWRKLVCMKLWHTRNRVLCHLNINARWY